MKKTISTITKKEIEKLKCEPEYVFATWAARAGWESVPRTNEMWTNGKDTITLSALRKVFRDYVEAHKNR